MQYVLRLELNFVEIGGIIKNKQFVSHLLEKNGQANGKSQGMPDFSEEAILEVARQLIEQE